VPTPEGAVAAATDEVTSTAAAASALNKTKDVSRVTKRKCPARRQAWLERQEWLQLESGVLTVWMARGVTWS